MNAVTAEFLSLPAGAPQSLVEHLERELAMADFYREEGLMFVTFSHLRWGAGCWGLEWSWEEALKILSLKGFTCEQRGVWV